MAPLSFSQLLVGTVAILSPLLAHASSAEKPAGDFTLVFVGGAAGDEASATLEQLKHRLQSLDPKTTVVVFTGNYSGGELPGEGEPGRARAERAVLAHVVATQDFVRRGGRVYFLAGDRDFAAGGTRAVRGLRTFLNRSFEAARPETASNEKLDVMPQAGCGDPTVLELTDDLGLVLLNSQWWMEDWEVDPQSNRGCEVKTRDGLRQQLGGAVFGEYRNRRLIVATHHPLQSDGELGGSFTARAHLTPAPIVGTLEVLARQAGLVPQYQNHPMVHSYVDALFEAAQMFGSFIFASGHDANLQYLQVGKQTQIISGTSGRSAEPTVGASEGDFAAASPGWAELVIEPAGGGVARFFSEAGKVLFETRLPPPAPFGLALSGPPGPLPPGPVLATYSKAKVGKMGAVGKWIGGSFYSDAYALELPYQVLDLQTEQGGLTPLKAGGGFQTNALKLSDPEGGEWSVRSTTKDSRRFVTNSDNAASTESRPLDHGLTATHPEAALVIPRLAQAVGVLHAEPRLMYLPDQEGLEKYRGYVGNEVVLLEQRPHAPKEGVLPEALAGAPSAAGKTRFCTTDEALEKMLEQPTKHRVDQEAMLRARLLDIFVGDWDRHQGQWRFAVIPNADGTRTYQPIPRDRDQALSNCDGLALALARIVSPQPRVLQPFTGDYGNLGWLIYGARNLDPILLNQLPRERWLAIAAQMKSALTDEVIDEAFSTWHREAYELDGARLAAALKARRDKLPEVAGEYFGLINKRVDVLGSRHDDLFELWFQDSGAVRLSVRARDGGEAEPWFDRVFEPEQTEELRIYGLEGDDLLSVYGTAHRAIDIRFVGGEGADVVAAASRPRGEALQALAIQLYDSEDGAVIDPSIEVRDERSNLAAVNQYDRTENHEPNAGTFLPGMLANPDDGVYLGGNYTYLVQGYKKSPFAARHELTAAFATATLGASLDYRGLFPQSAEVLDQQLEVSLKTPNWTRNFFGTTNAIADDHQPLDFYRVRQPQVEARYGLSYAFGGDRTRVGAQLVGQAIVTEGTPGRFITESPDLALGTLGPHYFAGARLFAQTQTFDNLALPRRGVGLRVSVESRYDVVKGSGFSTNYKAVAATAIPFDRQQRVVLLTRLSLEGIVGEHAFYFAPTLGEGELRATHAQQLAGDVAFAQTTDLRLDVYRFTSMPSVIGVNLSVDHGRVFGPSIRGNDYHLNYGGGVWWSILDKIGVCLSYHRGLEGESRFSLVLGPLFAPTGT